jgi:hypothetical protein
MTELRFKIGIIQRSFEELVTYVLEDKNKSTLDALNIEYSTKVKIISLLSSILKLISSLIHEILVNVGAKIKIKNKDYLHKQYRYFQSIIAEMYLSFNRLTERLDEKSIDYVSLFAKRNDSPFKTFLWSIMIFYETRKYPSYFVYKKEFKSKLFSTMKLIYDIGKKYSHSLYDELLYDSSTINNEYCGFPYARFYNPFRAELKKLEYSYFIRLLLERFLLLKNIGYSSHGQYLEEIKLNNKN